VPTVNPAHIIERHRVAAHLLLPAGLSLALMGLYFSGSVRLQAIVAPAVDGLHPFSWREFGALEQLQNLALLAIVALLVASARQAAGGMLRTLLAVLAALFAFVLLEEVDYGRHFVEYLSGEVGPLSPEHWNRNVHNRVTAQGVQYASYMRLGANVLVAAGFVMAPLLLHRSRRPLMRLLLPSRWMIPTVVLTVLLSWLAHALDDAGLAVIDGVPGNLEKNVSEFRELNIYYLFLLYAVELRGRLACGSLPQVRPRAGAPPPGCR
jgi:hypothetical protein